MNNNILDNMAWLTQINNAKAGKAVKCPKCSSDNARVELYAFEDLVGYAVGKCEDCNAEVYISRMIYKPTDKFKKVVSAQ